MAGQSHDPANPVYPDFNPGKVLRCGLAVLSGAIAPLAFSPNNMWLLGFFSVMGLYVSLKHTNTRLGAITSWWYGLGFFGVGVSWVYVSIHDYGNAGELLAGFLTVAFVAGLAFFFVLQGWVLQRWFNRSAYLFSFAALWILGEWFRGWFLTGFPWLYLGYPHAHSAFAGIAPIFGVMGISLVVALTGAGFGEMFLCWHRTRSLYAVARTYVPTGLFFLWIAGSLTSQLEWVTPLAGETVSVGIVQADIEQGRKFDRAFIEENLDRYETLSADLWNNDIVVWPETAIPYIYDPDGDVVSYFDAEASSHGTALVTGIFGQTEAGIHNSIVSLGNGSGLYHKQKLVPFGEYVPLRSVLSSLLQIFELPMSSLEKGPSGQYLLQAGDYTLAPFICYEVVYPDFVRNHAHRADFLVTISNDTWFGASWGPLQHLEMAAMRALENGRYVVRATNNGVSAIIDEKGNIVSRTEQFTEATLEGEVQKFDGVTPFSHWGSYPLLVLCVLWLAVAGRAGGMLARLVVRLRQH